MYVVEPKVKITAYCLEELHLHYHATLQLGGGPMLIC